MDLFPTYVEDYGQNYEVALNKDVSLAGWEYLSSVSELVCSCTLVCYIYHV